MQPPDELRDGTRAAGWLNKLLAFVKSTRLVEGVGYELNQTGRGVSLVIRPGKGGPGGGGTIARFAITSASEETITGTRSTDGAVITIAKPYYLRVSTWKNQTIGDWTYNGGADSRTATYAGAAVDGGIQPGQSIDEILDPPYDGDIFAAELPEGTGVNGVTWIDLNADGRRYVAKRTMVEVCKIINGVETKKKVLLEGGPLF